MRGSKPEKTATAVPLLSAAVMSKGAILPVLNSVSVCAPVSSAMKSPEYRDLASPEPKTQPVTPVSKYRLMSQRLPV